MLKSGIARLMQRVCILVTAIMVGHKNPYLAPLHAASFVLNGFGKSIGLMQLEELMQLESHIMLTNTLCASIVSDSLIKWNIQDLEAK